MFNSRALLLAALSGLGMASALTMKRAPAITTFSTSPVDFEYPPARGFSASTADAAPCGGISPSANRTNYPVSGGKIALTANTLVSNVNIMYTNESAPTKFHDFSTYTETILDMSNGDYCVDGPNFSELGVAAGQDVTLLTIYEIYGNDTYFYHCADIHVVETSAYSAPSNIGCTNSSAILDVATEDESMVLKGSDWSSAQSGVDGQSIALTSGSTTTTASSAKSDSGLTAAQGGGIGASVAIVVVGLILLALTMMRRLTWGKRSEEAFAPRQVQLHHDIHENEAASATKA